MEKAISVAAGGGGEASAGVAMAANDARVAPRNRFFKFISIGLDPHPYIRAAGAGRLDED